MEKQQEPKLAIKKVTPRALKVYKKAGLLDLEEDDLALAKKTFDIYVDPASLEKVIEVTFMKPVKDIAEDLEDIDLAIVSEGIQRFLSQLSANLTL